MNAALGAPAREDTDLLPSAADQLTRDGALTTALGRLDALLAAALGAADEAEATDPAGPELLLTRLDAAGVLAVEPGHTRWSADLAEHRPLVDRAVDWSLVRIADRFGLDSFELDALLIACSPDLDQRYPRVFGLLQDDLTLGRPTLATVGHLAACRPMPQWQAARYFASGAALLRSGVARVVDAAGTWCPAGSRVLVADGAVLRTVTGIPAPDGWAGGQVQCLEPAPWLLHRMPPAAIPFIRPGMPLPRGVRLVLHGPDRSELRRLAHSLTTRACCPLLAVRAAALAAGSDVEPTLRRVVLEAELRSAVLLIEDVDELDAVAAAAVVRALRDTDLGFVVSSATAGYARIADRLAALPVALPRPDAAERAMLWREALARVGITAAPDDVRDVATDVELGTAQIETAARRYAAGTAAAPQTVDGRRALMSCAPEQLVVRLPAGVERREARARWSDLVLHADQERQLQEVCAYARNRAAVLSGWKLGDATTRGRGVNVLLCGGSGTGKTTACEVLAAELGRILLVMDVAHVVSKYIGETEKRLAEVFDIAERSGAVLVVDEADALFGKRTPVTDAHDRYANREVSYLLQRMENYRGILVLTTNLQTNIDQAFARRLQFVIELTFPDERQRERIWQLTLPARAAIDPDVNPATLAATYPLAGGHIRSIAVGAAIFAVTAGEPIAMRHVAAAARRELQKLGRSVPDSSYPPAVPR